MLVAVEPSGDLLGAGLMRALRKRLGKQIEFTGVGGPAMQSEGLKGAFDIRELSVFGILEGVLALRRASRRARQLTALAVRERPDLVVLIDSWGFSYLLARSLRRRLPEIALIKYVAPQAWATRPGRARALARTFDHLLSIVAFEAPMFEAEGASVTFVGHPASARSFAHADAGRLRTRIGAAGADPILLVLPGSRRSEVDRLLPSFEEAVRLLKADRPDLQVVVVAAPAVAEAVKARVASWPFRAHVVEDDQGKDDAMLAASVALACSGTVTTELAVAGCPMVVAYKLGAVSYAIASRIIRVPYITLFNIAAGAMVAPELIQHRCTGPALAQALAARLDDRDLAARQAAAQSEALKLLGALGDAPSERAADVLYGMLAGAGAVSPPREAF